MLYYELQLINLLCKQAEMIRRELTKSLSPTIIIIEHENILISYEILNEAEYDLRYYIAMIFSALLQDLV